MNAATSGTGSERAARTVCEALESGGLAHEEPSPGVFVVTLPGERKLATTCLLRVGAHTLSIQAFVARAPDEQRERVYRWLLERNTSLYAVSYALDRLGDIYLIGRLPLHAVTGEEVDRVLGAVLAAADSSFNTILEMGFATSIRREHAWRTSRGESTANLAAFTRLIDEPPS